ncbi:hypothetical protein [Anaerotignum lactatifermentans]|uniref:hypothetical protein n=1 Tax=Anaerotignum lactatifermentans TaxID=160404 RepID=UPI002430A0EB|nr:hypothetical protein [Anaerotignum lactatifermentans]
MKKQKELTMILGVIVLVFVLNFFVFRLAYLQEPIFLTHAYAFTAEESSRMGFYYITNADEKRQPLEISCPELGEDEIFEVIDTEQWQGHGMYTWNEMWVDFDVPERVGDLSNVILTQMQVKWSDGTETPVDIGEVRFLAAQEEQVLSWSGMGAGDTDASYSMEVPEDLTVTGIRMPMENHFSDLLMVKDGEGQPMTFPASYQQGDTLSLETELSLTEKDNRAHMVIDVVPVLEMETATGEKVCAYLYDSMKYTPDMNILEIYRILHMKEDM